MIKRLPLLACFLLSLSFAFSQVTTSGLTGTVKTSKNEPLHGATIKATHLPTGTVYTGISQPNGEFHIANMKVGGPYRVEISFVGLGTKTFTDINLQLGTPLDLEVALEENAQTMTEATVTASHSKFALISPERMGTVTNISTQQLALLPTTTRSIDDFTRLVPQARAFRSNVDGSTQGVSFDGMSNKYNQFTIDGANATDVFGLAASGTNGGQASLNPIPFDAIDQVQVIMAPYDVTLSGFTGGGVNAVTKSGTNTLHGSVYGFDANQSFVGKAPVTGVKYGTFSDWTYGARLGGAFVPNKLFFFVNYEGERKTSPVLNLPGTVNSQIRTSALDSLSAFLKDKTQHPSWTYDPGPYNGFNLQKKSDAVFARLDWNISDKHKLTLRHSLVTGQNFIFSDAASKAAFYNNGYDFKSTNNSTVLELTSNFSSRSDNDLRLTFTATRDKRTTPGALFPAVSITDNGATYTFGSEFSSQANSLNQNTFTLTDNFNLYRGKHTFTFGTDEEFYHSANVFLQGVVGSYTYNSLASFYGDAGGSPTAFATAYSSVYSTDPNNPRPVAKVSAGQFALYAQDVIQAAHNFKLTIGLRGDMPVFFGKPAANTTFNSSNIATANGVRTDQVPAATVLLSPRIGFNWDIHDNKQTQLRGGVGLFTGRTPFVWLSNQYSNTGVGTISGSLSSASQVMAAGVHFNPNSPFQPAPSAIPVTINTIDPHFKYPRTLRTNLAVDQRLPYGVIGTIEAIFTKTLEDINYSDLNLTPSTMPEVIGNSTRPFYGTTAGNRINASYANVIDLGNTTQGYGYNFTFKLEKPFSQGWFAQASYSLGHSFSLNNGTSSVALSNWRFAYNINGLNNLSLGHSNYDQGSKIVAYVAKRFTYGKIFSTNVGLVYTGSSGERFSYVYFNDVNGDDGSLLTPASINKPSSNAADLMYLPTDSSQFTPSGGLTAGQQFTAFQQYENSTKYLKNHIGKNTEINGDQLPWENHFDLKLSEGINFFKGHTLTISVDILNVGNLIDKNGGRSYYIGFQEAEPLDVSKFTIVNNQVVPLFTYNPKFGLNSFTGKPWQLNDYQSRWSMLLGLRYSF